jgi:hypothetical protein
VEQGARLAFQPLVLVLPESLPQVLPRQEQQATPVSTWASPQVEPVWAEVMKAWQLVPPASELV